MRASEAPKKGPQDPQSGEPTQECRRQEPAIENAAEEFWSREAISPTHILWTAHLDIRMSINQQVTGNRSTWPLERLAQKLSPKRLSRGLSIGCGTGSFEREGIKLGLCEHFDAFDGSSTSIEIAVQAANDAGVGERITYYRDDFNDPSLPVGAYDIVVFHHSLHHVARLEHLLRMVRRSLRPHGILYLDEYVGPSREDWSETIIARQRAAWTLIPDELKTRTDLPLPIQIDDPSEAVRSSEIIDLVEIGFEILERRDYGGNLLALFYPLLRDGASKSKLIQQLIAAEQLWLRSGEQSFYTVLTGKKRLFVRGWCADFYYWMAPKFMRVSYWLRDRLVLRRYRRLLGRVKSHCDDVGDEQAAATISTWLTELAGLAKWRHITELRDHIQRTRDAAETVCEAGAANPDRELHRLAGALVAECGDLLERLAK